MCLTYIFSCLGKDHKLKWHGLCVVTCEHVTLERLNLNGLALMGQLMANQKKKFSANINEYICTSGILVSVCVCVCMCACIDVHIRTMV